MTSSQVTASSSLDALAAAADAAARAALHTLNVPGRERHSPRAQKARPKFPHASATKQTVTGKPQVTVFAPSQALTAARQETRQEGGTAPPAGAADRGTARHPRRDTRANTMPAHHRRHHETDSKTETGQQSRNTPTPYKHLKSVVLSQTVTSLRKPDTRSQKPGNFRAVLRSQ